MVATPSLYLILNNEHASTLQRRPSSLIDKKTGRKQQWITALSKDKHSVTIKSIQDDKDWQYDGFNAILEKPSGGRDMIEKCQIRNQVKHWLEGINVSVIWTGPQLRVGEPKPVQEFINQVALEGIRRRNNIMKEVKFSESNIVRVTGRIHAFKENQVLNAVTGKVVENHQQPSNEDLTGDNLLAEKDAASFSSKIAESYKEECTIVVSLEWEHRKEEPIKSASGEPHQGTITSKFLIVLIPHLQKLLMDSVSPVTGHETVLLKIFRRMHQSQQNPYNINMAHSLMRTARESFLGKILAPLVRRNSLVTFMLSMDHYVYNYDDTCRIMELVSKISDIKQYPVINDSSFRELDRFSRLLQQPATEGGSQKSIKTESHGENASNSTNNQVNLIESDQNPVIIDPAPSPRVPVSEDTKAETFQSNLPVTIINGDGSSANPEFESSGFENDPHEPRIMSGSSGTLPRPKSRSSRPGPMDKERRVRIADEPTVIFERNNYKDNEIDNDVEKHVRELEKHQDEVDLAFESVKMELGVWKANYGDLMEKYKATNSQLEESSRKLSKIEKKNEELKKELEDHLHQKPDKTVKKAGKSLDSDANEAKQSQTEDATKKQQDSPSIPNPNDLNVNLFSSLLMKSQLDDLKFQMHQNMQMMQNCFFRQNPLIKIEEEKASPAEQKEKEQETKEIDQTQVLLVSTLETELRCIRKKLQHALENERKLRQRLRICSDRQLTTLQFYRNKMSELFLNQAQEQVSDEQAVSIQYQKLLGSFFTSQKSTESIYKEEIQYLENRVADYQNQDEDWTTAHDQLVDRFVKLISEQLERPGASEIIDDSDNELEEDTEAESFHKLDIRLLTMELQRLRQIHSKKVKDSQSQPFMAGLKEGEQLKFQNLIKENMKMKRELSAMNARFQALMLTRERAQTRFPPLITANASVTSNQKLRFNENENQEKLLKRCEAAERKLRAMTMVTRALSLESDGDINNSTPK